MYFKSGSYYSCTKEEGFSCGKYKGNRINNMNSVAIIESPSADSKDQKRYIVTLMSNVLRQNSAWDHSRMGAAIEKAVQTRQKSTVDQKGASGEISDAGKS